MFRQYKPLVSDNQLHKLSARLKNKATGMLHQIFNTGWNDSIFSTKII
ncbi:hypothetical protein PP707_00965 [Acetobacter pasteurianus]|nr:hypothetical protein [Acetobacter pasteurianus]